MTGYGSADGQLDGVVYAAEIKTVNNRYFKCRTKLPDMAAFLEEDIEKLLRQNLQRGMVNYTLELKNITADVLFAIDEVAVGKYAKKLAQIASDAGINGSVDVSRLLNLPGIIQPNLPDENARVKMKDFILNLTRQALDNLRQMRSVEGTALEEDLKKHCHAIRECLTKIAGRTDVVIEEYRTKLSNRLENILTGKDLQMDPAMLAREVVVFADRSDISEEIARLESHLEQFENSSKTDGQAGRRLDFISQEMLREANTIASKAADVEIIHLVVDMKCWIDRIKEQVQNVE